MGQSILQVDSLVRFNVRRVIRAVVVAVLFYLIYVWLGKSPSPLVVIPLFAAIYLISNLLLEFWISKARKKNT